MSPFGTTPDPVVSITGWKAKGPSVTVQEYQTGFSNRRNRWKTTREDPKSRGRDIQHPESWVVHRVGNPGNGYDVVAFNKGFFYIATVVVDGMVDDPHALQIDALEDYQTIKIADGVDIIDVDDFGTAEEAMEHLLAGPACATEESDDEDAAGEAAGSHSDEEE